MKGSMDRLILSNAMLILPDRTVAGSVSVANGIIEEVLPGRNYPDGTDLRRQYLAPGVIDIHTDYLEREIAPRPGTEFPVELAFHLMDVRAIACGVTTVLGAARVSTDSGGPIGSWTGDGLRLVDEYARLRPSALARHYIHVRWDTSFAPCGGALRHLLANRETIGNLVFNDSTPGERQFRNTLPDQIRRYALAKDITLAEAEAWFEERIRRGKAVNNRLEAHMALGGAIPAGSHDDTNPDHVIEAYGCGASLAEMPVTIEAARKARELGMMICMGAPNYYRGGSHCGNLSCHEALAEGLVDILCSDYHFPSLLGSATRMMAAGTAPHDAFRLMTSNAARHLRRDRELGSIEAGKLADLVAFEDQRDYARVSAVWVNGERKFAANGAAG